MRIRKFFLAAVSLFTLGLASLSQFSFAGTWTTSEPGYRYNNQYGWTNGGNYTGGTYEWFYTADSYDTVKCQYCWDRDGNSRYSDYRQTERTKFDPRLAYVLLSQDGWYYKTYHRHFGSGSWGAVTGAVNKEELWFVDPANRTSDSVAPSVTGTSISSGWSKWYRDPPVITITARDYGQWFVKGQGAPNNSEKGPGTGVNHVYMEMSNGKRYYSPNGQSTDGGSGTTGSFSNTWSTPGWYTINSSKAVDNADPDKRRVGSRNVNQSFGYDNAAPRMNESHDTGSNRPSVTISLSASDTNSNGTAGSGINRIERWTGSSWSTIASAAKATYTVTANGTYKFRAVDNVGRTVEKSVVINNIDGIPPTVTVKWSKKPLRQDTLIVSATDNCGVISGYMVTETNTKPSASASGWQTSGTFTNRASSNKPYYCWAKDPAGNVGAVTADVKSLDRYPPKITSITASDDKVWSTSKTLTITADDNTAPSGYTGNSGVKDYALTTTTAAPTSWTTGKTFTVTKNGTYYLWVRDNVGWTSYRAITVNTIDSSKPTNPTLKVTRTDNGATVSPRVWINSNGKLTATGATAPSGIKQYEYKIGSSGTVTAMTTVSSENLSVVAPSGTSFTYKNVKEATATIDTKAIISVRAVSNVGTASDWVTFDLYIDKLAPGGTITPSTTGWTSSPINLKFVATDTKSDGKSGVSGIKRVKFEGSSSGKTRPGGWVTGSTLSIPVTESSTFTFKAEDNAGNVKTFTATVTNYDSTAPEGWVTGNDGRWTNQDITITLHGRDINPPTPPSGVSKLTTPAGSVSKTASGTQEVTTPYVVSRNGIYTYSVQDKAGNVTKFTDEVTNIDKVAPVAEWTEDVRYDLGRATIYIVADDDWSGVDYILAPDGTKIYADDPWQPNWKPGDPNPKLYYRYEITQNGVYTFTIFDRAGNSIQKSFTYEDLRHDYYAKDFICVDTPVANSDFTVQVTWGNRVGVGSNVPVELYYLNRKGERVTLAQDTITVSQGNEITWKTDINLMNDVDVSKLYAVIDPAHLAIDLKPADNTAVCKLNVNPFNYSITSTYDNKFIAQAQVIEIPVVVSGEDLGDLTYVPVEMYLDDQRITRTYVNIGEYNTPVYTTVRGYIPNTTSVGPHNLDIRVNWEGRAQESRQDDNIWALNGFKVQNPDLRLKFNSTVVTSGDVYSYPSKHDTYDVVIKAFNPNETLKSVTTLGKTVEPNKNSQTFKLDLDRQQKQTFHVVVQSACKQFTREYDITVVRLNDNLDVDIWVTLPDGSKYPGVDDGTGNYEIHLPITSADVDYDMEMVDPNANIVIVDSTNVNKNKYHEDMVFKPDSEIVRHVTVASEDPTTQKTFDVTITNANSEPSIRITNKSDINGVMYGLGGILKGGTFIPYGNDITSLEIAQRAGRTNGVAIEVEVKDLNPEQFLRGYVQLPGSSMKYQVRWNTFDGPTVIQASEVTLGYVYIDRTAMRSDMNFSDVTLYVSDYASESEAEMEISTATDKVNFAIDITAPEILATPNENAGTEDNPKGKVAVKVTDALSGVYDVTYRVSTDNGRTWTDPAATTANGTIDLAGKTGDLVVEVTAHDKILNQNSVPVRLNVKAPGVNTDADIFASTNRVSDVVFINIRKHNADQIAKEALDAFN